MPSAIVKEIPLPRTDPPAIGKGMGLPSSEIGSRPFINDASSCAPSITRSSPSGIPATTPCTSAHTVAPAKDVPPAVVTEMPPPTTGPRAIGKEMLQPVAQDSPPSAKSLPSINDVSSCAPFVAPSSPSRVPATPCSHAYIVAPVRGVSQAIVKETPLLRTDPPIGKEMQPPAVQGPPPPRKPVQDSSTRHKPPPAVPPATPQTCLSTTPSVHWTVSPATERAVNMPPAPLGPRLDEQEIYEEEISESVGRSELSSIEEIRLVRCVHSFDPVLNCQSNRAPYFRMAENELFWVLSVGTSGWALATRGDRDSPGGPLGLINIACVEVAQCHKPLIHRP
eukprot:GEMP01049675.1.p1 GENE.GEMP01049675.1~~GEMP01049675.1.p1  ORF type:complete len:337 (+),score=52.37 GEMP01049675.1:1-1011(+)